MATQSSILAWAIPWTEEPRGHSMSPWGHKELDMTEQLSTLNNYNLFCCCLFYWLLP